MRPRAGRPYLSGTAFHCRWLNEHRDIFLQDNVWKDLHVVGTGGILNLSFDVLYAACLPEKSQRNSVTPGWQTFTTAGRRVNIFSSLPQLLKQP